MGCGCNKKKKPGISLTKTAKSLLSAGLSVTKGSVMKDYDPYVTENEKQIRLEICGQCENLEVFLKKKRCGICKCFLSAKAALKDQHCPLVPQKW